MQLKEITIADLPDFVDSELFRQLTPKPITRLRALSQCHNPRARKEDTALIIAYENHDLIGLVGLLPNWINGQKDQPACSNTCWWAHPEKGKQLAIPLFLKAFALCGQRMFMTDCTPHTLSILGKTNWFEFPDTNPGIRGFLKFNLHEIIPSKIPSTEKLKPLFKLSDRTFNLLLWPYQKVIRYRFFKNMPKVEYLTSLNEELYAFIESHSSNEFIRRSGKDLEWIIQYPWIKAKNTNPSTSPVEYPFSQFVDSFDQYFIKITSPDRTIGLLMISLKNGHMKVPYAYFEDMDTAAILKVIYQQALLKNTVTLTLFNSSLVAAMNSEAHPFIFRKKIKRLMAVSKQLSSLYHQYPHLQDGDGDVVFT
ncbi:MAG TPA: hypothetical protein DCL77_08375 [Prolixibacteraceae bacterium]|jgi:hypothetical protein|nr:hypothetical protein [Prolixibacteraceae bacterium]